MNNSHRQIRTSLIHSSLVFDEPLALRHRRITAQPVELWRRLMWHRTPSKSRTELCQDRSKQSTRQGRSSTAEPSGRSMQHSHLDGATVQWTMSFDDFHNKGRHIWFRNAFSLRSKICIGTHNRSTSFKHTLFKSAMASLYKTGTNVFIGIR